MSNRRIAAAWGVLICGLLCMGAAPTTAPTPLEVSDCLAISSKTQLINMTIDKIESLGQMLTKVTDEPTARALRPAIERCYFEMEMLGTRLTMMGPPSDADREAVGSTQQRFLRGKQLVETEIKRIAGISPMVAATLKSVTWPVTSQLTGEADARTRSAVSLLQTLRSQIELYKLQHFDAPPDFRHQGWQQLTHRTNEKGSVTDTPKFGPYLREAPLNPLTGSAKLLLVRGKPKADFKYTGGDMGFVLDVSSNMIWALDAEGKILNESAAISSAGN